MHERMSTNKILRVGLAAVIAALLVGGVLLSVGCESAEQSKQKQFKKEWTQTMNEFQKRLQADDNKGQTLVDKNDLAGVIALTKQRIANVDEVLAKILAYYPPPELRKLDVLSTYYLISLKDRLEQQIVLYNAILAEQPQKEIADVLNNLIARNNTIGRELGIELQKLGIRIESATQKPSTAPSSSPQGTAPSTSPGQ
jgi:Zn-dependent oligopeptidase